MDDSIFHILMEPNLPSLSDSVQRVIRAEPPDGAACSCSVIRSRVITTGSNATHLFALVRGPREVTCYQQANPDSGEESPSPCMAEKVEQFTGSIKKTSLWFSWVSPC